MCQDDKLGLLSSNYWLELDGFRSAEREGQLNAQSQSDDPEEELRTPTTEETDPRPTLLQLLALGDLGAQWPDVAEPDFHQERGTFSGR